MRRVTSLCLVLVTVVVSLLAAAPSGAAEPLFARLETGEGNILLVFYPELAPNHVGNFTHLVRTGFYDGTKFHRIVPGFVIQGGDPNSKDADPRNDGMGGPTVADVLTAEEWAAVQAVNEKLAAKGYLPLEASQANLKAEFSQTAKHVRGTLSMARSQNVDSAGSQFFVCVDNTPMLDGKYTVFGHVVTGMDAADKIVNAEKNPAAGRDAPAKPVAINRAFVIEGVGGLTADEKAAWDAMPDDLKNVK
jgi:peptidyl-prolyl cis-trans isomerase B (cyclophilin B)